ncbi:hypothetical protein, partial [[Ruminococcus] torques]|uniref:hypothetical protein n=1 Tax=[Ruminococcus] torques TaxID=33039 RepID=UPI0027B9E1C0
KTANVPSHHHLHKIFQLLPKEQNPPNQFRDINRGRDIVADTLVLVLIFRGKINACCKSKEW